MITPEAAAIFLLQGDIIFSTNRLTASPSSVLAICTFVWSAALRLLPIMIPCIKFGWIRRKLGEEQSFKIGNFAKCTEWPQTRFKESAVFEIFHILRTFPIEPMLNSSRANKSVYKSFPCGIILFQNESLNIFASHHFFLQQLPILKVFLTI